MAGNDPMVPATDANLTSQLAWAGTDPTPEQPPPEQPTGIGPQSSWTDIRDALNNRSFDYNEDSISLQLIGDNNVGFRYLGAGSNKIAMHITGTSWVLLFGNPARNIARSNIDIAGEINTLRRLSDAGVPVPGPFDSLGAMDPLFRINLTVADQPICAFLQIYMPATAGRWAEMTKRGGMETFAATQIVPGGQVSVTTGDTLDCLNKIRAEMAANPWNDFQVMYNRQNGKVVVFDPMEFVNDTHRIQVQAEKLTLIDRWLDDIIAAIENKK